MIEFVLAILGLSFFGYIMCYIINKFMGEEEMNIYIVLCNGKVSSEAYRTLEEAQKFCESRGAKPKEFGNGWIYRDELNCRLYQITDVQVRKGNK